MDALELRDPIEVWQAAIGNTEPLEKRLQSHNKLTGQEMDALALFVGRKLKPPKRKKKIKVLSFHDMITLTPKQKVRNGVSLYKYIMSELKKNGESYGRSDEAIEFVAAEKGISENSLINAIRRAKPPKPDNQAKERLSLEEAYLPSFVRWCHLNWDEVQQYRG